MKVSIEFDDHDAAESADLLEELAHALRRRRPGAAGPKRSTNAPAPKLPRPCPVVPPTEEELQGVTPMFEQRVESGARRKGMVDR